ncbi:Protein of uncharacterised function (DUF3644) [Staphylococcus microti]|uniref:Protein of uncharacterized function (DUF3644) n=1 Tax=Staphylococcus microti TaxID=569857 RepID=A0A380GTR6_9STAP|nr:DUF3644 domain-containing protein [Staphylococcus microti]PNZ80682.1 DUF3644 domain-containing protein [Staphylococcus microti]SUM57822.1 Protein of uncharacterised function (DUF3644) [Staphylococcus microti]
MQNLSNQLVDKSIEAFILGLEIYNKPTIKYRIEGFSFFICNAWELMLKAELLNRDISIYYKDNPDRTINLKQTIKLIYPDYNTRIRLNLEKIVGLRNISKLKVYSQKRFLQIIRLHKPLIWKTSENWLKRLKRQFHNTYSC